MRSLAYTPLIVTYTVEILPYQLRAKGVIEFGLLNVLRVGESLIRVA